MAVTNSNSDPIAKKDDQKGPQNDFPHAKAGRIKFVTKILLDSKYGLMEDLNYNRGFPEFHDTPPPDDVVQNFKALEYGNKRAEKPTFTITISRSTKIRADRVRIYLDYYYSLLERYINIESPEHHHEGVEGVYNPIQIIRNRALRKKYHEQPPRELFIQKAPVVAIRQFSSKPKQKMPWYVNISERSSDLTWRTSHWDELVGPDGRLWFPRDEAPNITHKEHRHRPLARRQFSVNSDIAINTPYSGSAVTSSSPDFIKSLKESPSEGNLLKHLEVPASKVDFGDHRSDESEKSRLNRFEMILGKRSKRWSGSPHLRRKSQSSIEKLSSPLHMSTRSNIYTSSPIHGKNLEQNGTPTHTRTPVHSRQDSGNMVQMGHTTYMTPLDDNTQQRTSLLNALPIEHVRKHSIDQTEEEQIEDVNEIMGDDYADSMDVRDSDASLPQTDEQLQNYWKSTKYIMATLHMMQHRRTTHNIVRKKGISKREKFQCDQEIDDMVLETTEALSTYDEELNNALKKGNNLASKMLNDYSMRVETLISTSDRILSDINTTLTLKLKLFQEDADKFGTLKGMRSQKLYGALYRILEYVIVLALWTIWFIVSVIKWIKYIFIFTIKIIMWMLW